MRVLLALLFGALPAAAQEDLSPESGGVKAVESSAPAAARKILILGDSHSTLAFGRKLYSLLRESASKPSVALIAVSGAKADDFLTEKPHLGPGEDNRFWGYDGKKLEKWEAPERLSSGRVKTPSAAALLKDLAPDLTVIVLGSNHVDDESAKPSGRLGRSSELAKAVRGAGSRCVWVGPPDFPGPNPDHAEAVRQAIAEFSAKLGKAVTGADACEAYVESAAPVTRYDGAKAGEHLGPRGYEDWAAKVGAALAPRL